MKPLHIAALLALGAGCASTGGFKPLKRVDPFPPREALAKIEARPQPTAVFTKVDDIRVSEWVLSEPLPDTIGAAAHVPVNELDKLATEVAAKAKNGVASEAMQCLAHQLGEFYLAYGGTPEKSLKRFMEHRCGVTSETTSSAWTFWTQPVTWKAAKEEGKAIDHARQALEKMTQSLSNPEIGAWFGSNGERGVAMFAGGRRALHLEPMPMRTPTGSIEVAGRFFVEGIEVVSGSINVGDYEWSECHALPAELPAFRLGCQARVGDVDAGFELYTRRKGDLIASSRLWQRVWPSGVLADTFVLGEHPRLTRVAAEPAVEGVETPEVVLPARVAPMDSVSFDSESGAMQQRMLDGINALRAQARLSPVTLAPKQSDLATQLAPYYWGASMSGDQKTLHDIAFGLLAGWEVEGAIISGSFYTVWVNGGPDDLVTDLAARPGARDVLFGPEIATLSIGPHFDADARVVGGVVHGWAFVPDESHVRRVNRFLDYVSDAREARGNAKPMKIAQINSVADDLAKKLAAGEIELHHAAYSLVNAVANARPGKRAMVYYAEVHDPTKIDLPSEILDAVPLDIAVVVAPYKVPNSPWHTYGVVFAYIQVKSPTKVAELTSAP